MGMVALPARRKEATGDFEEEKDGSPTDGSLSFSTERMR
jgi:hypothetical protein